MDLRRALTAVGPFCLQLLWPARCAGCDAALPTDDLVFCEECIHGVSPLVAACAACASPRAGGAAADDDRLGGGCCAGRGYRFTRAHAAFEYGEVLAAAIMRMKHGDRPDIARRLGRLFQGTIVRALARPGHPVPAPGRRGPPGGGGDPGDESGIAAVLPVPLHPRRLRWRGFNQALDLALVALKGLGAGAPPVRRRLLRRVKDTRGLGRSGRAARREELSGAFTVAAADAPCVRGRGFLVVDDVMTTGATLNGCAEALLDAGAAEVRVAALARAVL